MSARRRATTTISVDVDIDLAFECEPEELAQALVDATGSHERAHIEVAQAFVQVDGRKFTERDGKQQDADDLRLAVAEALALLDRGRTEEGMHALRLICAPAVKASDYHDLKAGKPHPFLLMAPA